MVDGESHEIMSGPAGGAPPNRDKRPNQSVIEGELAASHTEAGTDAPAAATPEPVAETPADEPAPASEPEPALAAPPVGKPERTGAGPAIAAGAVAGAVVAALVAAAGLYLMPPKAALSEADAARITAAEAEASRDGAMLTSLDKRVGALEGEHTAAALAGLDKRVGAVETALAASSEAALDKRLSAIEQANAAEDPKIAADAQAVQSLSGDVKTLRADVDAARGEIPALGVRVTKLEGGASSAADLTQLTGRLEKLEAELAEPKVATRVAPEQPIAADNPAAVAIAAGAIRDKLASGASFTAELSALTALGVEPGQLAPLKALADGAPTDRALAASFEAVEPKLLAAVAPKETGGIGERLLAHLRGLIQVRNLGETTGDDPQALASQIVARLDRGDLDGALARFARLPEAAREAASGWAAEAQRKEAAVAAVQAIRGAAVARLAERAKP